MQSALFNHSQEEMSFPERKSVFHLHPEKSAGLDKIRSPVSKPGAQLASKACTSTFGPDKRFMKKDLSL